MTQTLQATNSPPPGSRKRIALGVLFGIAVIGGGVYWWYWSMKRPDNVGPDLCRELARRLIASMDDDSEYHYIVSDTARVTPRDDGSYLVGLTLSVSKGKERLDQPFYCSLIRAGGSWSARMIETP